MARPLNLSSHTELSTLSQCERRWWYQYVQKIRGEASLPMILGSTMGECCDEFWLGNDWRRMLRTLVLLAEAEANGYVPEIAGVDLIDLDRVTVEPYATAYWLMQRYERHYAKLLPRVRVVAQELDCRATIPGTKQKHQAIVDEIWELDGAYWMVERKTYGKTDKLNLVDVDPQLTNNLWVAAKDTGMKFAGIIFDGIYTYHWKPEKPTQKQLIEETGCSRDEARERVESHPGIDRPDSESFEMLFLDRTAKHIAAAQLEIGGQLRRRAQLRRGVRPIRNIGPFCTNCAAKSVCFEDLSFPQAFPQGDIELV
jgi:PD-(D/E)XK nuclease superfamily